MKSFSQAAQDLYFVALCPNGRSYVEVGCAHPIELSNTYALELAGWRGLSADINPDCPALFASAGRKNRCITVDATTHDFAPDLITMPSVVDALSFDVDQFQVPALENFLRAADQANTRFRALCVESDLYRFGPKPKTRLLELLFQRGYELIAEDVMSQECPFELWLVDPKLVDMRVAEKFRSSNQDWADVLRQGGISI